jgi:large subunit ribosomal protein L15
MSNLSNLKSIKSIKPGRRLGRGGGSSKGKTSGRGHKGYKARTGSNSRLRYEGGQNPIVSRIPKLKGFKVQNEVKYKIINVSEIEMLAEKGILNRKILVAKGQVKRGYKIKVLGDGEIKTAIKVEVNSFSGIAKEKIEKAGGQALIAEKKMKKEKK